MIIKLITELKKLPFIRLIIPFIIGIFFGINSSINIKYYIFSIIALSIFFVIFYFINKKHKSYKLRFTAGFLVYILFFVFGNILLSIKTVGKSELANKKIIAKAIITGIPEEKANSVKFIAQIFYVKTDSSLINCDEKILVYAFKDSTSKALAYGDEIIFSGKLQEVKNSGNPKEFNYKSFLLKKGIQNQLYLKSESYKIISRNNGWTIIAIAENTRQKLSKIYTDNGIDGDEFAVLSALTLGDKSELDNEIKQSYAASGAMHILAVSGLHVGIIFVILNYLLSFMDKIKLKNKIIPRIIKATLLISFLWFFAFLSGLSPSVRRAAVMFTILIIGKALERPVNIYNSLGASAFLLLLINPFLVTEVGFQMSYLAVLSIVIFQPFIVALFTFKNKLLQATWALTAVSIAAQLGTAPISLYYFHIFPNWFMLTNIFVIPLATIIVYGAALLFVSSIFHQISIWIAFLLKKVVFILNYFVKTIENLPFSYTDNIAFNILDMVLFVTIIISLYIYLSQKSVKSLQITLLSIVLFFISSIFLKYENLNDKKVVFYNVNKNAAYHFSSKLINKLYTYDTTQISSNVRFAVLNNLIANKKTDYELININKDTCKTGNFIKFYDKTFLIINDKNQLKYKGKKLSNIDYIILSNNIYIYIKDVLRFYNPKLIIFDSSNKYMRTERWEEECNEIGIKYFSIPKQGAFTLNIE